MEQPQDIAEIVEDLPLYEEPKKSKSILKTLGSVGIGGLYVGGGLLYMFLGIINFLYIALAGLGMVFWAISLFSSGSILLGLLVLLIGTPLAIGIAAYLFIPLLIISILSLLIWGVSYLIGAPISFENAWHYIWLVIRILISGFIIIGGGFMLFTELKDQGFKYLKGSWLSIIIACLVLWFVVPSISDFKPIPNSSSASVFEELNESESAVLAALMEKASDTPLSVADIESLRNVLKRYVERTGLNFTTEDISGLSQVMDVNYRYQKELTFSMMESWDSQTEYRTDEFNRAYVDALNLGLRERDLLELDLMRIKDAAANRSFTEDQYGNRYEFNRDLIQERFGAVEINKANGEKILSVYNEFVR